MGRCHPWNPGGLDPVDGLVEIALALGAGQLADGLGTLSVGTGAALDGGQSLTDGLGLRDKSWGPRYWQAIWWYRWLTVNLGPDLGFGCTIAGREGSEEREAGVLRRVGERIAEVGDLWSDMRTRRRGLKRAAARLAAL